MNEALIRTEPRDDRVSVRAVNQSAFDTSAEAVLVETLRAQAQPIISLAAEANGTIVGPRH